MQSKARSVLYSDLLHLNHLPGYHVHAACILLDANKWPRVKPGPVPAKSKLLRYCCFVRVNMCAPAERKKVNVVAASVCGGIGITPALHCSFCSQ